MSKIRDNTFAAACYEQNSYAELVQALAGYADATECATWDLTTEQWRASIEEAVAAKIEDIGSACAEFGAKTVADAAHRRMNGDRTALPKVGLESGETLAWATKVSEVAFSLMEPEERAGDLAEAVIGLATTKTD